MAISDKEQSDNGKSAGGRPFEVYYVEDQVLITGPDEQGIPEGETRIERVVDAVNRRFDVRLVPARGGEMSPLQLQWDLTEEDWECLEGLEVIPPELLKCLQVPLVMRPYDIVREPGDDRQRLVEEISRFINAEAEEVADPDELDPCVRIEPNWVIGYQYSVAGSPFGIPETAVQADEFWEQWALKRIGLIQNDMRATRRCGQGVRVGVFDTSPFKVQGCPMPAAPGHPPLLTVVHPEVFDQFPELPPPNLPNRPDPPDLNSHGLSVAGLAYAVAPHSDIYLYKVLDRHARGNLYVLCCALVEFINSVLGNRDAPNGGIINLSLGVAMPAKRRKEHIGTESVFALDSVLALAHCLGLTVVAAAGNESTRQGPPKSAGFPASQPYAIGVKASNYCNERSCFSNKGDVTAPGGDGYDCGEGMGGDCACPWDKVTGAERRKYGLVAPVLPDEDKFPHGFARWLGTSFATPLVSGLAALVREHHGGPSPSVVSSKILGHVSEGVEEIEGCDEIEGGIIYLPDYLLILP